MNRDTRNYNWILDNVALGNVNAGTQFDELKKAGIDVLIIALPQLPKNTMEYVKSGISFLHIPVFDMPSENIGQYFDIVYDFMNAYSKAGRKMLVHCAMGISRSATLLTAYIMKKYNIPYQQAIKIVQKRRPIVQPNPGFIKQLKQLN